VNVRECPDLIHHYWSRKQLFRAKVKAWIAKHAAAPNQRAGPGRHAVRFPRTCRARRACSA